MPAFDCPIYVVVRDRLSDLRALVEWLERAGHDRIVLVDNASTYPPLLEYLDGTPHQVVRLSRNWGSRVLWTADEWQPPRDEWFVLTDPDVLPIEDCPLDAVAHFRELLDQHPRFNKAGFGLYLDDVDIDCVEWERSLVSPERRLATGVYDSLIDTTFALHRPGTGFQYEAIRTGFPYQARHLSWYREGEPTDEDRFYLGHAIAGPFGSSWAQRIPAR